MRKIIFSKQAEKIINRLLKKEPKLMNIISKRIEELRVNPHPADSKKLTNRFDYRIRVKNYRIVYEYDNSSLYITIIKKRDNVYKSI